MRNKTIMKSNKKVRLFAISVCLITLFTVSSCMDRTVKIELKPVPETAILEENGYFVWGASAVKGDDGLYHLFYSRWRKEHSFSAWATHSEVAHAVSDNLFGPYKFKNVALPARDSSYWDGTTTHNPTIHKFGNKYYLYYTGNTGNRKCQKGVLNMVHRNNQRIGVAVTDDLNGTWKRFDKPIIDVSADSTAADALCTCNPAITQMPNGKFLMVYKCVGKKLQLPFGGPVVHMSAISDSPVGPFKKKMKQLFTSDKSNFPAEDPYIWTMNDKIYAIVKDVHGVFTGTGEYSMALFESENGMDWCVSDNPLVSERTIYWENGTKQQVNNMERPQLYLENGVPKALFFAVSPSSEFEHTFNIHTPLKD